MEWIVILFIVTTITITIVTRSQKKRTQSDEYPYRKKDALFSPAERSFLGVLNHAVDKNTQIFGKARVADVIEPVKGLSGSDWQKSFNKISGKHFDFLLCDKNNLSILCAIELNDSSHNTKKRKDRDKFLEGACKSADVPFIQIKARSKYVISEIQQSLMACLPERKQKSINRVCPKCSSKMVKKIAKKGKSIGDEFWACIAFPKCRHIETIN